MKNQAQKINNIIGQLEGVKKMMLAKKDCFEVLTQLKAVKAAVSGVMDGFIEQELSACMQESDKKNKIKKIFSEIIKK